MIPEKSDIMNVELDGGRLTVVTTDKFKTELITVSVELEHSIKSIIYANLLTSVMKRGCKPYPSMSELSRKLDDLYDANIGTMVTTTGGKLSMGFLCECLDEKFVPTHEDLFTGTLDVLRHMATEPLTDSDGLLCNELVEREKKQMCDRIAATENSPRALSYDICLRELFRGEPIGETLVGKSNDVMAVTNKELTDFFRGYLSSSRPTIVYVGSRSADRVISLVREKLSFFCGKGIIAEKTKPYINSGNITPRLIEEEMAVKQGKLTIGFRSSMTPNDHDIYASLVMNDIFGGSPTSKLFKNVREAKSLCYDCSSGVNIFSGAMFVRSGIKNENRDIVTNEVVRLFNEIKDGKFSDTELENAIRSNVFAYKQLTDSAYSLENFYRSRSLYGISESPECIANKLMAVTRDDVIKVSERFDANICAFIRGTLSESEADIDDDEQE